MENINNTNNSPFANDGGIAEPPAVIQKYSFSKKEIVMAFIAIALGFCFVKLTAAPFMTDGRMGLGTALFLLGILAFSIVYPERHGKFTLKRCFRIALCIAFSVNVFISSNLLIQFLDTIFVLLIIAYDSLAVSGERFERIRRMFPADMFSALLVLPFHDYGSCHNAVRSAAGSSKAGSGVKNALLGLAIAIPSTVVVCGLLMSADTGFADIITSFMDGGITNAFVFPIQLIISLPVGYYIYGLCRSSDKKYAEEMIDDERCLNTVRSVRFLSSAAGSFSALPVCVLYVIFFFSQLSYFMSSFLSKLPDHMVSYSSYARRGFFELCFVSLINLAIIVCLNLFCKYREDGKRPASLKVITCVLSIFTILLIATAVSKMVMYINVYGLTPLRVYTTWFMVLLAVIFAGIFLTMLSSKINLPKIAVTAFIILFSVLSFCNADGLIAKYNADRFLSGTLAEFDVSMMRELSTGAVPEAVRVREYLSKEDRERLDRIISDKLDAAQKSDARTLTVSDMIAGGKYF